MINYLGDDGLMKYTNSGTTTIEAGTAVVVGDMVGIAVDDIEAGDEGTLAYRGKFSVTAETGAWAQGENLYVTSTGSFTTASTGNTLAAKALEAKATAATTGRVILTQQE